VITVNPLITPKPVTDGQKSQFVTVVSDAVRKSVGTLINEMSEKGMLNAENFQGILGSGNHLAAMINQSVRETISRLLEGVWGCLKLISGKREIFIAPTDGTETIAEAAEVFGRIDPNFNDWGLNRSSYPTGRRQIEVYQLVETASLKRIFTSLKKNPDTLCLTQAQIKVICRDYYDELENGSAKMPNLFLFKTGQEFFVAWVYRSFDYGTGKPTIDVYRLDDDMGGKPIHGSNRVYVFLPKQ
jgi:hypothetical protein